MNVGANPFLDYLELPAESEKFAGLTAVVSGYGATQLKLIHDLDSNTILKERVHSNKLHSAEALVLSNEDCKKKYMVADTRLCANIIGPSTDEIRGLCYVSKLIFLISFFYLRMERTSIILFYKVHACNSVTLRICQESRIANPAQRVFYNIKKMGSRHLPAWQYYRRDLTLDYLYTSNFI